MAIIKCLSAKSKIGHVLRYIKDKEKTDEKIISGINCNPETAREEMTFTKELYKKTEGRQYYHVIQSFKPGEVEPEKAHEIGKEFAQSKFDTYECVVCTHVDKDHIHNHIVVNSVDKLTGIKYHSTKHTLRELKKENNRICEREGLSTPQERKNRYFTMAEIKTAEKGESLKFRLMNDIDTAKEKSSSRDEFIKTMEKQGYSVNWTDGRKYITYTMPEGNKFRDRSLPGEYSKEVMENGFRGLEKEKRQNREDDRSAGGKRETGRDNQGDFELFFRDKGSLGEHQSESNDRDGKLYDGKKQDAGMGRESRSRQENTSGRDKELRADSNGDKRRERGTNRENYKSLKGRTGKKAERTQGDDGQFEQSGNGYKKRTGKDQRVGEAKHEDGVKAHSEDSHSQHIGISDPDRNIHANNKPMANPKVKIEPDLNMEITKAVKKDLDETLKQAKEASKNRIAKKKGRTGRGKRA